MASPADLVRAADGRVPGRRGIATRQRLLDSTARLLSTTPYRTIKVIDIAREASTSPATFYQYFADVEQAVLVLAEALVTDAGAVAEIVRGDWRGERGVERARHLVEAFLEYYEAHRPVYRVVDLATEEGDLRFQQCRTRALSGITDALYEVMAALQADGRLAPEVDTQATAFVLVSMLVHSATHRYGMEFWGVRTSRQVEAMSRIIYTSITGRKMPAPKG